LSWTKVVMTTMSIAVLGSIFGTLLFFGEKVLAQDDVQVETKSLKDATHIIFSGHDEWRYDISRAPNSVSVQFNGLKPDDVSELTDLKDARVKSVSVKEGINGDALVTFTLAPGLNLFDYQTDQPVNLVFDIFKEEKKHTKTLSKKKSAQKINAALILPKKGAKKGDRKVASIEHPDLGEQPLLNSSNADTRLQLKFGIFDGGDKNMTRFKILEGDSTPENAEKGSIDREHRLYVHFPPLVLERPFFKNLVGDGAMKYEAPVGNSEEDLQARLLVKLYNEGKYAVVLRTFKFFEESFPKTKYEKMLDFLKADTYFRLWQQDHNQSDFEIAMSRYKELLNRYPTEESRFHTLMFIGANYLEAGNYFGALATFQVGIEKYADSPFIFEMKLAEAEVLNQLNKSSDALDTLTKIQADPKAAGFGTDAQLRRGDVYFHNKDYANAVKEYKETQSKIPDHMTEAPNIYFNMAEAQFWMGDYKASLESYRDFLERFPNHSFGGYAMTRIGEIFEMMGVNSQKVTGSYLEAYYRYRGTPGAFISKLYVNTKRFPQMKEKEVDAVRNEINDEAPKYSQIPDLDPFVVLSLARANASRGEYKISLDSLTKFYQKNMFSPYLPLFKEAIVQNIKQEMNHYYNEGTALKSVETYLTYKDSWLKNQNQPDLYYHLGQAYESLNLVEDATLAYTTSLSNLNHLTTEEVRADKALKQNPTQDEIYLRLAATSLKDENLKKTAQYLGEIKNPDILSESEKVERGLILSSLAEKEERTDLAMLALKDLNEHWKGKPDLLAEAWLRIGRLESHDENYTKALPWVEKVLAASENPDTKIKDETLRASVELAGDIHSHLGQNKEAIDSYKAYLDRFGSNSPTAAVKYKLGKIYFDQKDLRTASEVWSGLKTDEKAKVWAKMADENLSQAKWDSKYDRYLQRAPAGGSK